MKRILITLGIAMLVAVLGIGLTPMTIQAQALPPCATDGDMDGDGVPDSADADEIDSCTASSSGNENCTTGVGDGIPDCDDGVAQ